MESIRRINGLQGAAIDLVRHVLELSDALTRSKMRVTFWGRVVGEEGQSREKKLNTRCLLRLAPSPSYIMSGARLRISRTGPGGLFFFAFTSIQ